MKTQKKLLILLDIIISNSKIKMPLFHNFRATNVWKAFTLNSMVSALVILIAITTKDKLDNYVDKNNKQIYRYTTVSSIFFTLLFTFMASYIAYTIMHFVFGYGSGMTVPN